MFREGDVDLGAFMRLLNRNDVHGQRASVLNTGWMRHRHGGQRHRLFPQTAIFGDLVRFPVSVATRTLDVEEIDPAFAQRTQSVIVLS
jgi:hypothetical protein